MRGRTLLAALALMPLASATPYTSETPPARDVAPPALREYFVYVTAESADEVYLVRFDGTEATVAKRIPVGYQPTEIEGPHGLTVDPDGEHWYLTMAHGKPYGILYKYATGTDELVGQTELGLFPATMQISRATGLLYCVNFDLHGDMSPSSVSIVDPEEMVEVARVRTGPMPHGSRVSPDGSRQYSCAMMSGELFELDTAKFELTRVLNLDKNEDVTAKHKMAMDAAGGAKSGEKSGAKPDEHDGEKDKGKGGEKPGEHDKGGQKKEGDKKGEHDKKGAKQGGEHGKPPAGQGGAMKGEMQKGAMGHGMSKPTWVFPHPSLPLVYVCLNGMAQVVEVDLEKWTIRRRFETGKGPYNVEVTPDGKRMVVTYKSSAEVGIWDLESGAELARIPSTRKVTHGVVISPDSRFAFVSNEGIGGEKGTLDVFDLASNERVSTVELGLQAGGICFWKMVGE